MYFCVFTAKLLRERATVFLIRTLSILLQNVVLSVSECNHDVSSIEPSKAF